MSNVKLGIRFAILENLNADVELTGAWERMRAVWKVTSSELLTKQAMRKKCIIYKKYIRT
jgi:hypothetical protein